MIERVYILSSPQLNGKYKIGRSNDVFRRIGEIADELAQEMRQTVTVKKEMSAPMLFPGWAEKILHRFFENDRTQVPYHSGHTEWFSPRNFWAVVVYFLFLVGLGHLQVITPELTIMRIIIAAVLYYVPYPLDGMLLLALVFLAQGVLAVAALWAGWIGLVTILNFL